MIRLCLLVTIAIAYVFNLLDIVNRDRPEFVIDPFNTIVELPSPSDIVFEEQFVSLPEDARSVHAATAIVNARGELHCFWYGGDREGSENVVIYGARFDFETNSWTDHREVVNRYDASEESGYWVRKLGNPVAFSHPNGEVWLFYVNVSVGGWALSTINVATSTDGGRTFGQHKRLITTPFFNRSSLVRSPAIYRSNNTVALPIYHELISKHGEVLILDDEQRVIGKNRIPTSYAALQPALTTTSEGELLAFLRNGSDVNRSLLRASSSDNGESWSSTSELNLPNPNSAIAVLNTSDGILLALNNDRESRDSLSLVYSKDDGLSGQEVYVLDHVPNENKWDHTNEFSYPWMVRDENDEYHIFYTWQRTSIKHVRFNNAWLEQKIGATGK